MFFEKGMHQRLYDKRFDGLRFSFHVTNDKPPMTIMVDDLEEFETIKLPKKFAELFAIMLNDLHLLQIDKKSATGGLESLIEIVKNADMDEDMLKTCIKFGMDYNTK